MSGKTWRSWGASLTVVLLLLLTGCEVEFKLDPKFAKQPKKSSGKTGQQATQFVRTRATMPARTAETNEV